MSRSAGPCSPDLPTDETPYDGTLPDRYLKIEKWTPILDSITGCQSFSHFVRHMAERIEAGKSNPQEVLKFVDLVFDERLAEFFPTTEAILKQMGIWDHEKPPDPKNFHTLLLWHLFNNRKKMFVTADPRPEPKKVIVVGDQNPYKAGLQGWERQILWEYMFGAESKRAENLVRLFNSTMEFGFPPAALQKAWDDAKRAGKSDILRDQQGLPMFVPILPPIQTQSSRLTGAPHLNSTRSSTLPPLSQENAIIIGEHDQDTSDNIPPAEFLTEVSVDDDSQEVIRGPSQAEEQPAEAWPNQERRSALSDLLINRKSAFTEQVHPQPDHLLALPLLPSKPDRPAQSLPREISGAEVDRPLTSASEVDAFNRSRARNINLPQVPHEPEPHHWTGSEVLWRRQMQWKTEDLVWRKKQEMEAVQQAQQAQQAREVREWLVKEKEEHDKVADEIAEEFEREDEIEEGWVSLD